MDEEYGVLIDAVQEIVRVPEAVDPGAEDAGLRRGRDQPAWCVLPVVDQRRRFGCQDVDANDRQRIMVFSLRGVRTGFIVDSVSEVMRIAARFIDTAPDLSDEQRRLMRRVANLEAQKRMILLLEVNQLLSNQEVGAEQKAGRLGQARPGWTRAASTGPAAAHGAEPLRSTSPETPRRQPAN